MAKAKKRTTARRTAARRPAARKVVAQRAAAPRSSASTNTKVSVTTLVNTFLVMLAVNAAVAYLANLFFPNMVVLGTYSISKLWAVLYSMGALAVINTAALPFMYKLEEWKGRPLTSMEWMFQYFVLNFSAVYVLTRLSEVFGMGVSSWLVVAVFALVVDMAQGMAMMQYAKLQQK